MGEPKLEGAGEELNDEFTPEEYQTIDLMLDFPGRPINLDAANRIVDKEAVRDLIVRYELARSNGNVAKKRELENKLVDIIDATE